MNKRRLVIAREAELIRSRFPQFTFRYVRQVPTWFGTLQPRDDSPIYRVKITFDSRYGPKVWIVSPSLRRAAPHRYKDGSLCLYYPKDQSRDQDSRIATTIILWAAEWLFFYETWLVTDIWYGPEAPHVSHESVGEK